MQNLVRKLTFITTSIAALIMLVGFQGVAEAQVPTAPASCEPSQQFDAGLCYPYCAAGYTGVGPVCWGSGMLFFSSYGRGAGTLPMVCPANTVKGRWGQCYPS